MGAAVPSGAREWPRGKPSIHDRPLTPNQRAETFTAYHSSPKLNFHDQAKRQLRVRGSAPKNSVQEEHSLPSLARIFPATQELHLPLPSAFHYRDANLRLPGPHYPAKCAPGSSHCSKMDGRGAGPSSLRHNPGEEQRLRRREGQDGGRWNPNSRGTNRDDCWVRGRSWKGRSMCGAASLPGCRAPPPVRTRALPEVASAVPEGLASPGDREPWLPWGRTHVETAAGGFWHCVLYQ